LGNDESHAAVIIGAGPAGLAASRQLQRRGLEHVVLEGGDAIASAWRNLYDSLTLHTGKHMSALPGMPFPPRTPLFPTRRQFLDYLEAYAGRFSLPVRTGCAVSAAERLDGVWRLRTTRGEITAGTLVVAAGILSNPQIPAIEGRGRFRGRMIHSIGYLRPDPFARQRVLVVGTGNSGGEIAAELATAGSAVAVAVRSGRNVLPRQLLGIPIQYYACVVGLLPVPLQKAIVSLTGRFASVRRGPPVLPPAGTSTCPDVPLIGFHLVDAIRSGRVVVRGGVDAFTERGARFSDGLEEPFDSVILATGYRAALGFLGDHVRLDRCGFAMRERRVVSLDQPHLYFVGQTYDTRGGLYNIGRDARLAARLIARDGTGRRPTGTPPARRGS
jgi:cation diffusion facilitator CzcD-associated flavoprotein CzcO